jgi:hypothetical protein
MVRVQQDLQQQEQRQRHLWLADSSTGCAALLAPPDTWQPASWRGGSGDNHAGATQLSLQMVEEQEVPGLGCFSAYADGRVRVVFEDRTLLGLDGCRSTVSVTLPDGSVHRVATRAPLGLQRYVQVCRVSECLFVSVPGEQPASSQQCCAVVTSRFAAAAATSPPACSGVCLVGDAHAGAARGGTAHAGACVVRVCSAWCSRPVHSLGVRLCIPLRHQALVASECRSSARMAAICEWAGSSPPQRVPLPSPSRPRPDTAAQLGEECQLHPATTTSRQAAVEQCLAANALLLEQLRGQTGGHARPNACLQTPGVDA